MGKTLALNSGSDRRKPKGLFTQHYKMIVCYYLCKISGKSTKTHESSVRPCSELKSTKQTILGWNKIKFTALSFNFWNTFCKQALRIWDFILQFFKNSSGDNPLFIALSIYSIADKHSFIIKTNKQTNNNNNNNKRNNRARMFLDRFNTIVRFEK